MNDVKSKDAEPSEYLELMVDAYEKETRKEARENLAKAISDWIKKYQLPWPSKIAPERLSN
jgi:hypothetical protein